MWDTAGQERFRSMTSAFFGKAQGALVVFDVSDRNSFENLGGWIDEIQKVFFQWDSLNCFIYWLQAAPAGCAIIICANKVDLPIEKWQVSRDMFREYAESTGYALLETSASNGRNANEVLLTWICFSFF